MLHLNITTGFIDAKYVIHLFLFAFTEEKRYGVLSIKSNKHNYTECKQAVMGYCLV